MSKTQLPRHVYLLGLLLCLCVGLRLWPWQHISQVVGVSRAVYAQDGTLLRLTLAPDGQYRLWVPLHEVSPTLRNAVLLYEDRSFDWHMGFSPTAIVRAVWQAVQGQRRQGASTITMQLARRLYGIDSRSATGKIQQIVSAVCLELRYSKQDIFEAYLNTVPYGGNIEGVGAASLIYFKKPAAALGLPEAMTLAVIPQNPVKRMAEMGRNPELQAARLRLWQAWVQAHPQDRIHAADIELRLDSTGRAQLPFIAPHLTDFVLQQSPDTAVHTSIDVSMQRTVERVVQQYISQKSNLGLNNASVLLLNTQTMQVKALLGSANYHDEFIFGQVNGAIAKRSPGSTLKPILYGLALDQGVLHPKTVLKDAPTSFGPFTPENFDNRFAGALTAEQALIRSRNVPAVAVAAKLKRPNVYDILRYAGVKQLLPEDHYGLALILGGGEVTMEELASLYAMLANGGHFKALQYTLANKTATTRPVTRVQPLHDQAVLSPEAAFIVLDMLKQTPRPDTQQPAKPAVAWKTGTSWGFRDAWTAGVIPGYVLVVWMGNFDSNSNPAFVGVDAAAPLFFRIVDALRVQSLVPHDAVLTYPPQLQTVQVCAATGGIPDALCPKTVDTWFIAGKSPIVQSHAHQEIWIDRSTGKVLCQPSANADKKIIQTQDSDLQSIQTSNGLTQKKYLIPNNCKQTATYSQDVWNPNMGAPVLLSPKRGQSYVMRPGQTVQIPLLAQAPGDVRTLYWFIDDSLVGTTLPGETLTVPIKVAGDYTVRVVDEQGRAELRSLKVEHGQ